VRARFLRVHRSIAILVSAFEGEFDVIEILVLGQRLVVVRIGDRPILFGNAASKLGAIECAIVIGVELVENLAGRRLRFIEVDRAVIVRIDPANTDAASEGESANVKADASRVLRLIRFMTISSFRSRRILLAITKLSATPRRWRKASQARRSADP
jgi:hypothetical protein